MGKSSAPAAPDLTKAAVATSNSQRYNEIGPNGEVTWTLRPGADPTNPQLGDYTRTTTLSPQQQALQEQGMAAQLAAGELAQTQLGSLSDGTAASDAAYRRATQYYDTNFDRQAQQLRTQLLNSGLAEGTEAYRNELESFNQRRDSAYADAADRAVATGETSQNNSVARLAQILAMSRGTAPTSSNTGSGTDLTSALMQQYQAQLAGVNANNAQSAQEFGTAAQLGALGLLAFSDRRLKFAVRHVGTGYKNLPIYEYTIFSRRERGYMADEVQAVAPEAVKTVNGIQMVAYDLIGGRP